MIPNGLWEAKRRIALEHGHRLSLNLATAYFPLPTLIHAATLPQPDSRWELAHKMLSSSQAAFAMEPETAHRRYGTIRRIEHVESYSNTTRRHRKEEIALTAGFTNRWHLNDQEAPRETKTRGEKRQQGALPLRDSKLPLK